MALRTRTRTFSGFPGFVISNSGPGSGNILSTATPVLEEWKCEDSYKKKARADSSLPPSSCVITKHFRDPYLMNGNGAGVKFVNHVVANPGTTSEGGFDSVRPSKGSSARNSENATLALELLAATNPFRTEFSVPVAIKELIDVTSLFKLSAKSFSSMVGGMYLNYKFGWVQFVRDIKTLHEITTVIERRIKEFDSLERKGGLRRNVRLRTKSATYYNASSTIQSSWGVLLNAQVHGEYACETRGSVRWRLKPGVVSRLDKLSAFNLAVSQVFDLGELDPQTVWNMIPFSWLVDYFVDMNSAFGAVLGDNIVEPYDVCIIRKCRSRFQQRRSKTFSGGTLAGSGRYGRDTYDRDVITSFDFPTPTLSLLSFDRVVTLAALLAVFRR